MSRNEKAQPNPVSKTIVLFDGVCNLCIATIRFVIERDPQKKFLFAPLQSEVALKILRALGHEELASTSSAMPSTLVVVDQNRVYTGSSADLRLVRRLRGLWPLLYSLIIIPRPIRDGIYEWISQNRYKWFGKQNECALPKPEDADRFLK